MVVRVENLSGIRRYWLLSSGPQRTSVVHSGITKPLIIGPPSFDTSRVYWHNLTNGEAASGRLVSGSFAR